MTALRRHASRGSFVSWPRVSRIVRIFVWVAVTDGGSCLDLVCLDCLDEGFGEEVMAHVIHVECWVGSAVLDLFSDG